MEIKDSVTDIPVQDPVGDEFSAADLTWTKFRRSEHDVDDVALIPYDRVDAFITGECNNVECPTRFHIERKKKRESGSLKEFESDEYLVYRMYWCSFGPENYGDGGAILPSRKYRLNTRNRAARPQSMRGCTCHFTVKCLYARPSLALIIYHERRHVNKSGFVCHGPLDRDAIGPGAKTFPYVASDIQQQTMSLIYLGIPEENVLETHIEGVQRYCGPNSKVGTLASQYVQKLGMIIKRSTHELALDDQASIRMWAEKNKKSVFFYQDATDTEPFILGIQTEWQLQQMIRFSHQSLLASDSTFGVSKLKYPLQTLLVFDSRQQALPVAWVITRSITKNDVAKWMNALSERVRAADLSWRVGGFVIDDPALELGPIQDAFRCPILLSLWRIRRSLLKNLVKKCSKCEVRCELFKRLGVLVYSVWSRGDPLHYLDELFQDFIDQTEFVQYFKSYWVPKMEMWLQSMRNLPLASQELCGAIEGYHLKLKLKIYDDSHLDSFKRVDWLVHRLTTGLHASYRGNLFADESSSSKFPAVKEEYILSSSWHRAQQIPDHAIHFDGKEPPSAKVVSQNDSSKTHTVWNAGSEFSLCDCEWSMQGNLCKHVIKVNMLSSRTQESRLSLSAQSFQRVLLDLWQKLADNSMELDLALARVTQMQERVEQLSELVTTGSIVLVAKKLPVKWTNRRRRSFSCRPADLSCLLSGGRGRSSNKRRRASS